jgi:hypothetical protein
VGTRGGGPQAPRTGYDRGVQRSFVVPAALAPDGRLLRPAEATPGTYACPGCGARIVLRAGPVKVRHFAHGPGSCSTETALHAAAKRALVQVVQEWAGGGPAPVVRRTCAGCERSWDAAVPAAQTAVPEHRLEGGLRPDVALLAGTAVVLALEVRVRHAVDEAKAARMPVPFLELDAHDVLAAPRVWQPIAELPRPDACPACIARRDRDARELRRLAAELGVDTEAHPGWEAGLDACAACGKETIRFTRGKGTAAGPTRGRAPPGVRIARVKVRGGFASRTVTACFFCGG